MFHIKKKPSKNKPFIALYSMYSFKDQGALYCILKALHLYIKTYHVIFPHYLKLAIITMECIK